MIAHETLDKAEPVVVGYWRLSGIIGSVVLFGTIGLQGVFFLASDSPEIGLAIAGGAGALGVLRIAWILFTTRLRYRRLGFSVDAAYLRIQHGVLVHREKTIPISRLQHLDVDRGPIERLFGLASLSVFTAGGRAATFRIPGLSPMRAEAMRAQVLSLAVATDAG